MSPGDSNARKPSAKRLSKPRRRTASAVRPTKAQQERFLELTADGHPRNIAARKADPGLTGSRFRAMVREGSFTYDAKFAAAYQQACETGAAGMVERLDDIALTRLGNSATCSDRALHNERIFRDPEYRAAHRQGAQVSVTTEMEVTNVHIAIEGARDRLVQKLAPVLELVPTRQAETGDRLRSS